MPSVNRWLLLMAALGMQACGQDSKTTPAAASESPLRPADSHRDGPQAPLTVRLEVAAGTPSIGAPVRIRAHLVHVRDWSLPITVDILPPNGAELTRGNARYVLTPTPGSIEEQLDFDVTARLANTADLVVVADSQSRAGGVHATARYRFGRPEPLPPAPTLAPQELTTGRARFGKSVALH